MNKNKYVYIYTGCALVTMGMSVALIKTIVKSELPLLVKILLLK